MNVLQMNQMIKQGKANKQLHLSAQQGLDQLTASDISLLVELLKRDHMTVTDLSLEDLIVTDAEAANLVAAITFLPLESFAVQGEQIGDHCMEQLHAVLSHKHHLDAGTSSEVTSADEHVAKGLLKRLVIGGYTASDASLHLLMAIMLANPSLKTCSVNWSPLFTVNAALKMVKTLAVTNISLVENDAHGFFHTAGLKVPKAVNYLNAFVNSVIHRNKRLATLRTLSEKIRYYEDFFTHYHQVLQKSFHHSQSIYGLYGFQMQHFLCESLKNEQLLRLMQGAFNERFTHENHGALSPRLVSSPCPMSDHLSAGPSPTTIRSTISASRTPMSALINSVLPADKMTPISMSAANETQNNNTAAMLPPSAFTVSPVLASPCCTVRSIEKLESKLPASNESPCAEKNVSCPSRANVEPAASITLGSGVSADRSVQEQVAMLAGVLPKPPMQLLLMP